MKWTDAQRRVIDFGKGKLLVSASAGSGKTTVMIERIIALIEKGYSMKNMLVSTFTVASAEDMHHKFDEKLRDRYKKTGDKRFLSELEYLPSADVCTMHKWCQKIIRKYFYVTGDDPAFEIADDSEKTKWQNEAIDRAIEEARANNPDFSTFAFRYTQKRNENNIKNTIKDMLEFASALANGREWISKAYEAYSDEKTLEDFMLRFQRERKTKLEQRLNEIIDYGAVHYGEKAHLLVNELRDRLEGRFLGVKYTPARNVPLIKDDINEMRKRVASYLEEIEKFDSAQNDMAEKDAKIFSALALRAYDLYEQTKIENGKLDFTDLERKTKEILSSPVGEEIRNSLTHIFIDEYQDINPLQESIINLAGKDNLFFVGDIKQSIYAFRNCSPSAFAEKRDTLGSSNVVELNRNYRSKTGILTFVNQLFSRIMSENFGMVDYAQTSRFYTEGDANDNSVEIILTNKPKRNSGKADFNTYYSMIGAENEEESGSAELEAISVVESIIKFLAENKDYSYKDVVVLTRSRGSVASAVERNLRKVGIPVSVGREVNVSEGKVNSLLLSYLRLIDNFRDDVSLIAVMRSNIGGFSDAELVKMRATHEKDLPFYEIVKKESETNEKVNEFLSELNEYVSLSQVMPLSALAGRITADKKLFFTAMSDDMGLIKADALGQLMENISEFRGTLSEYLEYLEEASPKVKVSAQAGSVRIMTIHASKGLEFPAVFLCGLNTKFKTSASKSIVCDSEFGLALPSRISATEKATPSIPLLIARHKQKKSELEEEMRVLYVALTRAKEKLFLFLADNNYKDKLLEDCNCYAEWIYPTAVSHGIKRPSEPEESEEEQSTPPTIKDETVNGMKELLEYDYSGNAYDLKKSVTAVITEETEGLEMKYTPLLPDYEEAEGGKRLDKDEAMARGTFLHACLENMDFNRPITEQMHVFRAMNGYSDDMERALCTAHEKISAFVSNRRTRKEQPFIIKSEGIEGVSDGALVQGVIDLLIIDGNEAEIIDYKSGSINEYRKVKYSKQLDLYATATQKILGLKVIKTSVYMIDEGRLIDRRNLS